MLLVWPKKFILSGTEAIPERCRLSTVASANYSNTLAHQRRTAKKIDFPYVCSLKFGSDTNDGRRVSPKIHPLPSLGIVAAHQHSRLTY